jgi:hypothetical protein
MALYEEIFHELNEAGARYVLVGGLATVLHGYARLTADVDLVVDLAPGEAAKTIQVLEGMGLSPRVPVPAIHFADPDHRRRWIEDKGARVFTLIDVKNPLRAVDLFLSHPIPFEELWERSVLIPLNLATPRVASIPDLIRLKELADRPQDREDIEALEKILERTAHDGTDH